jgi:F-type H+-transporting ATPase subunit gamma
MSNLKEVRTRIQSIRSTRQITSAMKMVSASKLHKSQQALINVRHYYDLFKKLLDAITLQPGVSNMHPFTIDHGAKQVLVISVASNKGLCGTFNAMVLKRTLAHIQALKKQQLDYQLLLIGKKNDSFFKKSNHEIFSTDHEILDDLNLEQSKEISSKVSEMFIQGTFDRVDVVYNCFQNAVVQELVVEQLLPIPSGHSLANNNVPDVYASTGDELFSKEEINHMMHDPQKYLLEPNQQEVMDYLLPLIFSTNLYRVLLESSASEHGARMTSMHKATDNADDLLKSLTLDYNKVRQSMITREIMEIVSGAEVLNQ